MASIENKDQIALRAWITAGLKIPEVAAFNGDAGFLLNNMIAKYSLAADQYSISEKALEKLNAQKVKLDEVHLRRSFYGKNRYGKKRGKNPFIYEHVIPAVVIRDALMKCDGDANAIRQILGCTSIVAIILRTEDELLRENGLSSSMPKGWKIGDDPLARYNAVGIQLAQEVLKVSGAIYR